MSSSQRDLWRERWLHSIYELTSLDLQINTWLNPHNENPHWSFLEFMSCYFDDLAIDNNYTALLIDEWITIDEFRVIKDWHETLENYYTSTEDKYDHEAILADPNWIAIVKSGSETKHVLNEILNETERQYLKI